MTRRMLGVLVGVATALLLVGASWAAADRVGQEADAEVALSERASVSCDEACAEAKLDADTAAGAGFDHRSEIDHGSASASLDGRPPLGRPPSSSPSVADVQAKAGRPSATGTPIDH